MLWFKLVLIAIVLIVFALFIYFALIYSEAHLEVKSAPREPMFECQKHGIFRKAHAMKFLDVEWCPFCFDEKIHTQLDGSVIPR